MFPAHGRDVVRRQLAGDDRREPTSRAAAEGPCLLQSASSARGGACTAVLACDRCAKANAKTRAVARGG